MNELYLCDSQQIDLKATLDGGQAFRWHQYKNGFRGIIGNSSYYIFKKNKKIYLESDNLSNDKLDMYQIDGKNLYICHLCVQLQSRGQKIKDISMTKQYGNTQIVLNSTKKIKGHNIFGVRVTSGLGIMFFVPVRYGNNDEVFYTNIIPNYNEITQQEIWSEILKYYLVNTNTTLKRIYIFEIKNSGDLEKWTKDEFIGSKRDDYIQSTTKVHIELQDILNNLIKGTLPTKYNNDNILQQIINIIYLLLHTNTNT